MLILALCLLFATGCLDASNVSIALGTWQPGIATLYGGDTGTMQTSEYRATIGSCGYTNTLLAHGHF